MPIVVPCHRVLHTGGQGIGNYTGGVHRKKALLRLEGVLLG
jgi:O6-methylguanine-DNA--protein-cysteine methyltransferase